MVERYEDADGRLRKLQTERSRRIDIRKNTEWFLEVFTLQTGMLAEFDESLFFALTDVMTVYHDGRITVRFRDGVGIDISSAFADRTA